MLSKRNTARTATDTAQSISLSNPLGISSPAEMQRAARSRLNKILGVSIPEPGSASASALDSFERSATAGSASVVFSPEVNIRPADQQ